MRFKFLIPFIDPRLILRFLITLQLLYNVKAGGLLPQPFFGFSSIARFLGVFIPVLGIFHPISCRTLDRRALDTSIRNLFESVEQIDPRVTNALTNFITKKLSLPNTVHAPQKADERKAWLGLNFFGRPESKEENVVMKWANDRDREEWKTRGFDLEDVLFVSRFLGMDGHFLDSFTSTEVRGHLNRWLWKSPPEGRKLVEVICWFIVRLREPECKRRLMVLEKLINPDGTGKPWWTPSEIEQWIQHTDWDPSIIITVGYTLRLDNPHRLMSRQERSDALMKLIQLLDPKPSSDLTNPSSLDSKTQKLKMVTYIPEALAVDGKPYRYGAVYRERINILTGVLHPDGTYGPPAPGTDSFRLYWIARGIDPDEVLRLDEEQLKQAEPMVSFESFAAGPRGKGWVGSAASLANFVLQLPLGFIRHIWKDLANLMPA